MNYAAVFIEKMGKDEVQTFMELLDDMGSKIDYLGYKKNSIGNIRAVIQLLRGYAAERVIMLEVEEQLG